MIVPHPCIATVEEFYAHALAIEREAVDRYAEFEEYFAGRGEDVLSGLCHSLGSAEQQHFEELSRGCEHLTLPAIAAADHRWLGADAPETAARELLYRVAAPCQLLEIALAAEIRAGAFFVWAAGTAASLEVRSLAKLMAAEEAEHVEWVKQAIEYHAPDRLDGKNRLAEGIGSGSAQP